MSEALPKTVVMGNVCIDREQHATVTGSTTEGRPVTVVEQATVTPGSPAVYYHRFLSHRGVQPFIIAPYGPDFNMVRERSKDTSALAIVPPSLTRTLVYENTITDGKRSQRCVNTDRSADIDLSNPQIKYEMGRAGLFIFAPLTPDWQPDQAKEALSLLDQTNPPLRVLALQGLVRNIRDDNKVEQQELDNPEIVEGFDLVFMSDEDTKDPKATAEGIIDISPQTKTIVTSRNGATIFSRNGSLHVPTNIAIDQDNIVHRVGSGDIFAVATSYHAYTKHKGIVKAAESGNFMAGQHLLGTSTYGMVQ